MINKTLVQNQTYEISSIVCDKCKEEISIKDYMKYQEFVSIRFTTGYGNHTFGDDTNIEIDLCQNCFYEIFKNIAREV